MRDLLFKNLTSADKKKRIISSSEITDNQGIHSIIRRHFICMVREVVGAKLEKPLPYLYILKEHNTKERKEKFFCRIKSSTYVVSHGKLFLILFMHSLRINLSSNQITAI
ncbi:MAG: hypothetical protein PHO70_02280 [Candidatus Omnitrophica bacterium]|nr:hypothetical protein [Candidatus Omnitrophota bacterium]